MKFTDENTPNEIINDFNKLKSKDDLLTLLNKVLMIVDNTAKPFDNDILHKFSYSNSFKKYNTFEIKKKTGGMRTICAPVFRLKQIQACLNIIFQLLYKPNGFATGFVLGKSILDNAKKHTNKNYVFNIDLENFFPSISEGRVFNRFQSKPFNLNKDLASLIAGLCVLRVKDETKGFYVGSLPQGAPTSPTLTNFLCQNLDLRLSGLAKRYKVDYSRYADDITFSSNFNCYREKKRFVKDLRLIISKENFNMNEKKVRVQNCAYKQEVTGVIVNKKANVTRKYLREIRVGLYFGETYGNLKGTKLFFDYWSNKTELDGVLSKQKMQMILHGKLMYMKMLKGEEDSTYSKLIERYNKLIGKVEPVSEAEVETVTNNTIFDQIIDDLDNKELSEIDFDNISFDDDEVDNISSMSPQDTSSP